MRVGAGGSSVTLGDGAGTTATRQESASTSAFGPRVAIAVAGVSATRLVLPPRGLLCILESWLRLNFQVSVIGVDRHEEVMQEAL